MPDKERLSEWDLFVHSVLQMVIEHQLVGSYDSSSNIGISIVSVNTLHDICCYDILCECNALLYKEDPSKLGTDLELYNLDDMHDQV